LDWAFLNWRNSIGVNNCNCFSERIETGAPALAASCFGDGDRIFQADIPMAASIDTPMAAPMIRRWPGRAGLASKAPASVSPVSFGSLDSRPDDLCWPVIWQD